MEKLNSNKSHFLRTEESQIKVKGNSKKNFKLKIGFGILHSCGELVCFEYCLLKKIKRWKKKSDRSAFFM